MFVYIQDYSTNYMDKGIILAIIVFKEYSRKNHSTKYICIHIYL